MPEAILRLGRRTAKDAARSYRTPPETLAGCALLDADARAAAARNPRTPAAAVLLLAHDDVPRVRAGAVCRPEVPWQSVAALALSDPFDSVVAAALRHPDRPAELLASYVDDRSPRVRASVAAAGGAWPAVLAGDESPQVRRSAATAGDEGVHRLLVADPNGPVRAAVAAVTPDPALLRVLACDAERPVRRAVTANPACPDDAAALLTLALQ